MSQLVIAVIALILGLFGVKWLLSSFFSRRFSRTPYGYIQPMLNASEVLLPKTHKAFKADIMPAVSSKEIYFTDHDNNRYFIEYIHEDDDEKMNQRYLDGAKRKELKIIRRDGLKVLEFTQWFTNTYNSLERYLFDYAQKTGAIIPFQPNEMKKMLSSLLTYNEIDFDLSFLENKDETSAQVKHYKISYEPLKYTKINWSTKEIAQWEDASKRLQKEGWELFIVNYQHCGNPCLGVVPVNKFKKLPHFVQLEIITIDALFKQYLGERVYTKEEKFTRFYAGIKAHIDKEAHEYIYRISPADTKQNSLSSIGGNGLNISSYPQYQDSNMQHVLTLDLNDFECLQKKYPDLRAIALYINDLMDNEAFEIDSGETKVLLLKQEDINSTPAKDKNTATKEQGLNIEKIKIPQAFLKKSVLDYDDGSWQAELYGYIYNFNYVCGDPTWVQNEDRDDGFIVQFDDSLLDINLGGGPFGSGIMYVFEDDAYWQM